MEKAREDKGGFDSHRLPTKGNHLDHDLLFGEIPKGLEPASTPARIWRIHPQESQYRKAKENFHFLADGLHLHPCAKRNERV